MTTSIAAEEAWNDLKNTARIQLNTINDLASILANQNDFPFRFHIDGISKAGQDLSFLIQCLIDVIENHPEIALEWQEKYRK